ncbi:PEGA domain-containing protein [Patescibacteria group bacterium]|nr:PEGA domain-containing protein [Patescibacteria group bacterium]
MIRKRIIIFLTLIIGIATAAYFLTKLASGYRFDFINKSLRPTGLLVANSLPNQATILITGKTVKNKTATTLSLTPGEYQVEIKKDGFSSWQKKLLIEKELVVKTDAYLFPTYPELKPLTFTGAANPVISPDNKIVAFAVDSEDEKGGLWVLDLIERPLGLAREAHQIIQSAPKGRNFAQGEYQWSSDSKQILITLAGETVQEENFLLDASLLNDNTKLIDITEQKEALLRRWANEKEILQKDKISRLPEELINILDKTTKDLVFPSDETKILYAATASASIPKELIPPLPGASTQPEERDLQPGKTYVYDLKEDRNFAIDLPDETKVSWFPTSKHLFLVQNDKISIREYDNTNQVNLYSGPFENSFAFTFPSGNRLLILTSLSKDTPQNLYAITLR